MFLNKDYADSDEEEIFVHTKSRGPSKNSHTADWQQPSFCKRTGPQASFSDVHSVSQPRAPSKPPIRVRNYQIDLPPREDDCYPKPVSSRSQYDQKQQGVPQLSVLPEHKQPVYLRREWKEKLLGVDSSISPRTRYDASGIINRDSELSRSWMGGTERPGSKERTEYRNIPSKLISTDYEHLLDGAKSSRRGDMNSYSPIFRTEADDQYRNNQQHQRKLSKVEQTITTNANQPRESSTIQNKLVVETGIIQICLAPAKKISQNLVCPNCHFCLNSNERNHQSQKSATKPSGTITEQLLKLVNQGQKSLGKSFQESSLNTSKTPNRSSVEKPGNYLKPKPRLVLNESSTINLSTDYDRRVTSAIDVNYLGGDNRIFKTDADIRPSKNATLLSREQSKENVHHRVESDYSYQYGLKKQLQHPTNRSASPLAGLQNSDRNDPLSQKIYYQKLKQQTPLAARKDSAQPENRRPGMLSGSRDNLSYSHSLLQQPAKPKPTGIRGAGIR